jgi:hypothetical protein
MGELISYGRPIFEREIKGFSKDKSVQPYAIQSD